MKCLLLGSRRCKGQNLFPVWFRYPFFFWFPWCTHASFLQSYCCCCCCCFHTIGQIIFKFQELIFLGKHEVLHWKVCILDSNCYCVLISQLKALGIDNILGFDWPASPPPEAMIRALEVLYSLGVLDDDAKLTSPVGFQAAEIPLVCCLQTIVEIFGFYCWIVYLCTSFSHLRGIIMNFFLEWNTCSKHIFYLIYPLDDKMRKCSKSSIVTSKRSYCSSAQPDAFVWFVFQLFCIFKLNLLF